MSEHAGGGSPALNTNPPLPLIENPAKQELPQPATPTAQQRIPHKRTTSRETPGGRMEWPCTDSKIDRSKEGSVPEMALPQDPELEGLEPIFESGSIGSTEHHVMTSNHEDSRYKHGRVLAILNCQNCQTAFVSPGERAARKIAGSSANRKTRRLPGSPVLRPAFGQASSKGLKTSVRGLPTLLAHSLEDDCAVAIHVVGPTL